MTTATRTTKSGAEITAEIVRNVIDKVDYTRNYVSADGKQIFERIFITIKVGSKFVASGDSITPIEYYDTNKQSHPAGVMGKLGNAWLSPEAFELATSALAEVEAATPGSAEFQQIKSAGIAAAAKAKAAADAHRTANAAAYARMEAFERKMSDPNSDL